MKPSIPKGTRDFSPRDMLRRNYLFDTIRNSFQRFGFLPLETPSMENLSTLTGKYGEEGDKLIFKILNSGDYLEGVDTALLSAKDSRKLTPGIAEKALRYDLTVPFARYVVMHQHEISFPFRRYQIQPVWRADRPQKGRYREFYQCDADIIGTNSLICELDLVLLLEDVFRKLNLKVTVKINNRKILSGLAEVLDESERMIDITVALDKLDKIGVEKVQEEMRQKGVSDHAIDALKPVMEFRGSDSDKMNLLQKMLTSSETGRKGMAELDELFTYLGNAGLEFCSPELDITLARGLNYYTGAIFEVKLNETGSAFSSSICGGGRYDDLTGIFGLPGMSGVGISFGADRICDVLEELNRFPAQTAGAVQALVVNFGKEDTSYALKLLQVLRNEGINAEIFPDTAKMKRQLSYADANKIPFAILAGSDERASESATVKNLSSGEQKLVSIGELAAYIQSYV
jgi:histidyl-tRNA synthetase